MIKGDLRKKQILETAEKLFCQNGYEKTSVQDILDLLRLSKGSFYHHYESKEMLLSSICEKRAEASAEQMRSGKNREYGIAGVDQVLSAMIPFNGAGLQFLSMILPVFLLPEGRSVRESYQEALKKSFCSLLMESFDSAIAQKEIYCENPDFTAGVCLDLVNDLWRSVSEEMIHDGTVDGTEMNTGEMLVILEQYRRVLESILSAPYGSLRLIGLEDLENLKKEIKKII